MAATMATRKALGLPVKTKIKGSQIVELAHGILETTNSTRRHRDCTMNTSMGTTIGCKARGLKGEHLIRCELLLIKSLLLLLQSLDLILKSNL
jgi:hypothetical protein